MGGGIEGSDPHYEDDKGDVTDNKVIVKTKRF
jgi:hypothetical protein